MAQISFKSVFIFVFPGYKIPVIENMGATLVSLFTSAEAWQNQYNDLCAQQRLRSA